MSSHSSPPPNSPPSVTHPINRASSSPPTVTLSTYALAAIATCLEEQTTIASETPEFQFLLQHLAAVDLDRTKWPTHLTEYVHHPAARDIPLLQLAKAIGLTTAVELLTVVLAVEVEENVMVGRALARLQHPLGGSRPTLSLLAAALAGGMSAGTSFLNLLVTGTAVQSGLLTLMNEEAPLPEQTISVPLHLCLALANRDGHQPGMTIGLGDVSEVPLPEGVVTQAKRYATSLQSSDQRTLAIRTSSLAEGRSVALAIARAIDPNARPLFIETEKITGLGPWLLLRNLVPVFCCDLAPGERKRLPSIPFYHGPVLALNGLDGSLETSSGAVLSWQLPVPDRADRQKLWQQALNNDRLANHLAEYHRHSSGRIAHLSRLARQRSLFEERDRPILADVSAAAWTGEAGGLEALAQPLPAPISSKALVMTPALKAELNMLLLRCRGRDSLVDNLGISAAARYQPGVRALFVGPSGTGKTLAAGWLATQLKIPLYRVDLSSIISKYIGETEKNLAQLMARAEQEEVVLLFDEADSLFGKRTDVKDSTDRFANAQTNYLLQRIESFDGITILTSNSRSRFDSAFTRRLDQIIEFPLPGPEERLLLWQSHLGQHHQLSLSELNRLAAMVDLVGGHIRNAVLSANVIAQSKNGKPEDRKITFEDVIKGLAGEYRKLGRQLPQELRS
jgi:hypothetical protein